MNIVNFATSSTGLLGDSGKSIFNWQGIQTQLCPQICINYVEEHDMSGQVLFKRWAYDLCSCLCNSHNCVKSGLCIVTAIMCSTAEKSLFLSTFS